MKTILYANAFAQPTSGPDEMLLTLMAHLPRDRYRFVVASPEPSPYAPRYQALGAITRVVDAPLVSRSMGAAGAALFPARLLAGAARYARLIGEEKVDLVHTNMEVMLASGMAARLRRVPSVYHYHGNSLDRPRAVFTALCRTLQGLSDKIFCISEATAAVFRQRGLSRKIEVLYNGVDLTSFEQARPAPIRAELGIEPGEHVVLTTARLHPRKDLATLVRAAALVKSPARFLIAGDAHGAEETRYARSLRAMAGPRVTFLGRRDDVPALCAAADLFVLPSRHEGFGLAVAEAMAAGLAVIATDEGAFPELLAPDAGVLCPPEDERAFAAAIDALLTDPARRESLGEAGNRRVAERFSATRQAARVAAVYEELLAARERTTVSEPSQ